MIRRYDPISGARIFPFRGAGLKALALLGVGLAFSFGAGAARGGAIEDLENATGVHIERPSREQDDEAEAERRQAWAEYRAEQAAERAAAREARNRAVNQAYQAAESSRQAAESSADRARAGKRELEDLRDAVADPAEAAAADRRVQEARRTQAALAAQLADLQKWTDSLGARSEPGFDTAIRLNEADLYKVVSPAQFVTPAMYDRARAYRDAQRRELRELQEQSRFLSAHASQSDEQTRREKQAQSRAFFGLGSDLLDLLAPSVAKGSRSLKIRYERVNLSASLINTVTAPDRTETVKSANDSLGNYISFYNEARLDPALANDPKTKAAVAAMGLSLKLANTLIDRRAAGGENPGAIPPGAGDDFAASVELALDLGGVVFPEARLAHAAVSLNERADQYVRAQNAMAQIAKIKGQGIDAQEYIENRILQLNRDLESTERTIKAFELGGRP